MFLVIIFLALAALGTALFPDAAWPVILGISFACTASFRLILFFTGRASSKHKNTDGD